MRGEKLLAAARLAAPFALALLLLLLADALGERYLRGFQLDLGASLNAPTRSFGLFLAVWTFFGGFAAVLLAFGVARLLRARELEPRLAEVWREASERKWLVYGTLLGFVIPAALRSFLLLEAPLTDDESAYRFMAQVLAMGRVVAESPPLKLFFDNRFLINDGKMYAPYFLGWPALMLPGVWLGLTGYMNSLYAALTVPALFLVLRRLAGGVWAKAGIVLYLSSPMLMVGAATETSHTSCVFALAWLTWFCLRSRDPNAPAWSHAGTAAAFALAFFIRPTSALGVGLPLLVVWVFGLRSLAGASRRRAVIAFAGPALLLATAFFAVNKLQTGSFTQVAYQRHGQYYAENDYRFAIMTRAESEALRASSLELEPALAVAGAALLRLNYDFLGWPFSLFFACFAGRGQLRRPLLVAVFLYFAVHYPITDVGIDTFAPMHYFELAWPLLLLSVCGLARLARLGDKLDQSPDLPPAGWRWGTLPPALAGALVAVTLVGYVPVRFATIHRLATDIQAPRAALAELGVERAVIFASDPFIHYCHGAPARGWVFARPDNDPRLRNDLLWVNHLSVEKNRLLMERFPDRPGLVMFWNKACKVVFAPLESLAPGAFPDARVSGIDEVGR